MKSRAYIRTDASYRIGSGHVMRCLTLADGLRREAGIESVFLCREHEGNLIAYIRLRGYDVRVLSIADENRSLSSIPLTPYEHWLGAPWQADAQQTIGFLRERGESADWLIIDHYALDERYESKVRSSVRRILVIDDLADRRHACDVLLDANYYNDSETRYDRLLEPHTIRLLGPSYAMLRESFANVRKDVRRDGALRRVLISFGGADRTGETLKTLQALQPLIQDGELHATVLAGKLNRDAATLAKLYGDEPGVVLHEHVEDVAPLMRDADLAIGSGGSTTWERCCVGLPALIVTTAANQVKLTEEAARAGVLHGIGRSEEVDAARIRGSVLELLESPEERLCMSRRGMELVDGQGTMRIAREVLACQMSH